jgi:hypothetical protein
MDEKFKPEWKMNAKHVYICGIIGWLLICILAISLGWANVGIELFNIKTLNLLYFLPFIFGFIPLAWNLKIWWSDKQYTNYETEVEVIEFAERNANYIILAITAVCILAQMITATKISIRAGKSFFELIPIEFIYYQGGAMLCAIIGVLPLIWMPPENDNAKSLVWLRHLKTIFYTYSIFLLSAGIIGLFKMCL